MVQKEPVEIIEVINLFLQTPHGSSLHSFNNYAFIKKSLKLCGRLAFHALLNFSHCLTYTL